MRQSHKVRFDEKHKPVESGSQYHDNCFICPGPECLLNMPKLRADRIVTDMKVENLAAQGYTKQESAEKLNRSVRTIDKHLKGIV